MGPLQACRKATAGHPLPVVVGPLQEDDRAPVLGAIGVLRDIPTAHPDLGAVELAPLHGNEELRVALLCVGHVNLQALGALLRVFAHQRTGRRQLPAFGLECVGVALEVLGKGQVRACPGLQIRASNTRVINATSYRSFAPIGWSADPAWPARSPRGVLEGGDQVIKPETTLRSEGPAFLHGGPEGGDGWAGWMGAPATRASFRRKQGAPGSEPRGGRRGGVR